MATEARKTVLLLLLVVMFGWIIWRQLAAGPTSGLAASLGVGESLASSTDGLPEVVDLRLADLEHTSRVFSPGRDPFRLGDSRQGRYRETAPVDQPRTPTPEPRKEPPAREERRSQPNRPQPPPVDVVFLGSFGPGTARLAVFSDGVEIYNVLEGDVLKGKFVVQKIGYESADLGFVGFPETPPRRLEIGG